jgi:hypothetical protein
MAKQLEWTKASLEDVTSAVDAVMGKVSRESLLPTKVLDSWDKVQMWLKEANSILARSEVGIQMQQVPLFPLSGKELRALQISVDRIAHAQASASPSASGPTPARLFESLTHLRGSSYVLIIVIACSLAASLISFFLFQDGFERFFLGASVVLALIGIGVSIRHSIHLSHHEALLQQIHGIVH